MTERIDHTEPVLVALPEDTRDPRGAGYPVAEAVCRYTIVGDDWWGLLSDIRPAGALDAEVYRLSFGDGRTARVWVIAVLSPGVMPRRSYHPRFLRSA